jgi:hypothetical protein
VERMSLGKRTAKTFQSKSSGIFQSRFEQFHHP